VWIRRRRWRVDAIHVEGDVGVLDVAGADGPRTFLTPFDRPWIAGSRGDRRRTASWPRARATLVAMAARQHTIRSPLAALDARVELLPFQLEAALILQHRARRVLLADAVGLGKTVQAGLVIAETLRRTRGAWVLVLVPAAIRDQWIDELATRFGVEARTADAATLRAAASDTWRNASPWQSGVWVATPDFIKQPHVFEALPLRAWDLLVIDEAHDVAGASDRHRACDVIARRSRRVLLLTATPHNGDEAAFARLQAIGELGLAADVDDELVMLRRTKESLGWPGRRTTRLLRIRLTPAEDAAFDTLLAFEAWVLRAARHERATALLLLSVLRKRALSSLSALAESVRRRAAWLHAQETGAAADWQQHVLPFDDGGENHFSDSDGQGLAVDIGVDRARERAWLRRIEAQAERAAVNDSRLGAVARLIRRAREPVVVFTEFRHSLDALARRLRSTAGVVTLHGGMSTPERRAALEAFNRGDASVLVATDVAGQGLNLQTRARWIVNLELPWNPARLEQRAGRVDRIGQRRNVHVTIVSTSHAAEAALTAHVAARALRARTAAGVDLAGVRWPTELEVGAAIIGGSTMKGPAAVMPVAENGWARRATWVTRNLRARRRWAGWWKAGGPEPARTIVTSRRPPGSGPAGWLLVFSGAITAETGAIIESHLAAYRVEAPGFRRPSSAVIERAREDVARRLRRRAARVTSLLVAAGRQDARVDRAIDRDLAAARSGRRHVGGLFDRAWTMKADVETRDVRRSDVPCASSDRVALVCIAQEGR
jgi:superfamily II DNA or RNA helicase